ncbi:hypothetical protein C5C24_01660 [Rathayibacter sp. AY2B3]|uniref:hypothetical protein n=1 Tax=Rathayibacter sp. AY2B3 TaxID=2080569 RepID=UPI000CE8C44C|nr:hypothetical protein [Rathayibacter sp. AY2B3]PPG53735.1 hypothetical protein C5C24_01660 [Rathayibacter sp. AY2B3]
MSPACTRTSSTPPAGSAVTCSPSPESPALLEIEQYGGTTVRLPESVDYLRADLDTAADADAAIRAVETDPPR